MDWQTRERQRVGQDETWGGERGSGTEEFARHPYAMLARWREGEHPLSREAFLNVWLVVWTVLLAAFGATIQFWYAEAEWETPPLLIV